MDFGGGEARNNFRPDSQGESQAPKQGGGSVKSILSNAKIVGCGIDPAAYVRQEASRGDMDFVMSRGELMEFHRCPHRWKNGFGGDDETKSTEWGTLLDCILLEPDKLTKRFAIAPETYLADGKKKGDEPTLKPWNWNATACKEWRADQEKKGLAVVKSDTLSNAKQAASILRNTVIKGTDCPVAELLDCSKKQMLVMAEYWDAETGIVVPLKGLLDLVPGKSHPVFGKTLGDFKTSASAHPEFWTRKVFEYHYDAQAALYFDMFTAATGEDRTDWFHLVQENFPPYEVANPLPMLTAEFLDIGRQKYFLALRKYARCLASNEWPSYGENKRQFGGFYFLEPLPWMQQVNEWPELPPLHRIETVLAHAPEPMDFTPCGGSAAGCGEFPYSQPTIHNSKQAADANALKYNGRTIHVREVI